MVRRMEIEQAPRTVKSLLDEWPKRAVIANDLNVKVDRVHKWAQMGSIPQEFMAPLITSAGKHGIELTAQQLIEMHTHENRLKAAAE